MASETRAELLKELAKYASASFVARADRLASDDELRDRIAGAKAQEAYYRDAGFEDESQAPGR